MIPLDPASCFAGKVSAAVVGETGLAIAFRSANGPIQTLMSEDPGQSSPTMEMPAQVPLFPLPDHVLLPGLPAPFTLFEPSYCQLAAWLNDLPPAHRWLAVPCLTGAWQGSYQQAPPFKPIAALTRVLRLEEQPDGSWFLLAEGVARVRLVEVPSAEAFRFGVPTWLPDLPPGPEAAQLATRVRHAVAQLSARLREQGNPLLHLLSRHADQPLIDHLGALLLVTTDDRQHFLEERSLTARARLLLRVLGVRAGPSEPSLN